MNNMDLSFVEKYASSRSLITYKLVNSEINKDDLLKKRPITKIADMALIYQISLSIEADHIASIPITNEIMDKWGVTERDLYVDASINTPRLFPFEVEPLLNVISDLMGNDEVREEMEFDSSIENNMVVISNRQRINGAVAVMYPGMYNVISKMIGGEFYILPSSKHEVIAISKEYGDIHSLEDMVRAVNDSEVDPFDRLSYCVYELGKEQILTRASASVNIQPDQEKKREKNRESVVGKLNNAREEVERIHGVVGIEDNRDEEPYREERR